MTNKRAYCFFTCIVFSACIFGQAPTPVELYLDENISQRDFDEKKWEKATKDIDYSGGKVKNEKSRAAGSGMGNADSGRNYPEEKEPTASSGNGAGAFIMKILIIMAAIIILVILLRNLLGLKGMPKNKKINAITDGGEIALNEIEENLHDADPERFIRQALEKGDYKLVIRLYYLSILKELSLARSIKWKKDKTNRDYLREMRHSEMFEPFREVTHIFEWVWYGGSDLTYSDYVHVEPKFKALVNRINRHE